MPGIKPKKYRTKNLAPEDKELSQRDVQFINEYLKHFNATRAAQTVGVEENPRQIGFYLKTKPNVRAEINRRLEVAKMSSQEVLARLSEHAAGTVEYFLGDDGKSIDLTTENAKDKLHLIRKLRVEGARYREGEVVQDPQTEIELHDAQAALEKLGRHYGLFIDKSADGEQIYREHMARFFDAIEKK
jgi:phage terminase small subunit